MDIIPSFLHSLMQSFAHISLGTDCLPDGCFREDCVHKSRDGDRHMDNMDRGNQGGPESGPSRPAPPCPPSFRPSWPQHPSPAWPTRAQPMGCPAKLTGKLEAPERTYSAVM